MKKIVIAMCVAIMMAFSSMAFAATPDSEALSTEQTAADQWINLMIVKNDTTGAVKTMSPEAQKAITDKTIKDVSSQITKNLGKYQEGRFVSWVRYDQADEMTYLMSFSKEKLVRCVMIFNKNGQMDNFSLTPVQVQQDNNTKAAKK